MILTVYFPIANFILIILITLKKTYNGKDAHSLKIIKQYNIKCGIITNDKIISIKHAPHIFDNKHSVFSKEYVNNIISEYNDKLIN